MASKDFRRFRGGEVPRPWDLNRVYDELRRWRKLSGAGGVVVESAHGDAPPTLSLPRGERVDLTLTGPFAAGYPWAEQILTPAGVWVATGRQGGPGSGDPAFERRVGDTTLTADGTVYHAVRSRASNQLVFPRRNPNPSQPPVTLPGCPCAVPRGLFMHVQRQPPNHVESVAYASPLNYGPRPSNLSIYRSDDPGFYGDTRVSSDLFYKFTYWFGCSQGSYFVGGLLTPDSPLGYPGFFLIASWLVGLPGNQCSPQFKLDSPAAATPTFQQQGISIDGSGPA